MERVKEILATIPNFKMEITKPDKIITVLKLQELLEFVGPKWPLFIAYKTDQGNAPGDTGGAWILAKHDGEWFGYFLVNKPDNPSGIK